MSYSDRMEAFYREAAAILGIVAPPKASSPEDHEAQLEISKFQLQWDMLYLQSILNRYAEGKEAEEAVKAGTRQQRNPAERTADLLGLAGKMEALQETLRDFPEATRPATSHLAAIYFDDQDLDRPLYDPVLPELQVRLQAMAEFLHRLVDGSGMGQGSKLATAEGNLVHECWRFAKRSGRTKKGRTNKAGLDLARLVYRVYEGEEAPVQWGEWKLKQLSERKKV